MTARAEPTERDHAPVDAAVGRYASLCDEYARYVRAGDDRAAEKVWRRIERARVKMVDVGRRFNARFPVVDD